jgi:hypothetical protein
LVDRIEYLCDNYGHECKQLALVSAETAQLLFKDLEERNGGWDGLMVNSYWVKKIKEKYGVVGIETRELGVNIAPFKL